MISGVICERFIKACHLLSTKTPHAGLLMWAVSFLASPELEFVAWFYYICLHGAICQIICTNVLFLLKKRTSCSWMLWEVILWLLPLFLGISHSHVGESNSYSSFSSLKKLLLLCYLYCHELAHILWKKHWEPHASALLNCE